MSPPGARRRGVARRRRTPRLLCPDVRFADDYPRRLERLVGRLASLRERREGAGGAALAGGGEEFVGYRPYRSGEDLRGLDWNLFARLDRPWVRVTRREASERWELFLDASASMGVGPPGKLQAAAEIAGALIALALSGGAHVRVVTSRAEGGASELIVRRRAELGKALAFLGSLLASGERGLARLLDERRPNAESGRVFLIGDLFDLAPDRLLACLRRGRELLVVQVLAPLELAPPRAGSVEWLDAEGTQRRTVDLGGPARPAYERLLARTLEGWDAFAARHGVSHRVAPSDRDFEDVVRASLRL